jgi:hypothetical protein
MCTSIFTFHRCLFYGIVVNFFMYLNLLLFKKCMDYWWFLSHSRISKFLDQCSFQAWSFLPWLHSKHVLPVLVVPGLVVPVLVVPGSVGVPIFFLQPEPEPQLLIFSNLHHMEKYHFLFKSRSYIKIMRLCALYCNKVLTQTTQNTYVPRKRIWKN